MAALGLEKPMAFGFETMLVHRKAMTLVGGSLALGRNASPIR
jgi:hypothetical protein